MVVVVLVVRSMGRVVKWSRRRSIARLGRAMGWLSICFNLLPERIACRRLVRLVECGWWDVFT